MKKYQIIYADPPWKYSDGRDYPSKNNPSGAGGASKHYPTLSLEELKSIKVKDIADENCALFMWATFPKLDWAIEVMKAWGFRYTTAPFLWVKTKNDGSDIRLDGIGSYTLNNAEIVLLGKRGKYWRASTKEKQIVFHPKLRHSEKPAEIRDRIVRLMGDVSRIELFAREKAEGWDVFGNEVSNSITL